MIFRLILAAGGLGMLVPGLLTDIVGLALVAAICLVEYFTAKREKKRRRGLKTLNFAPKRA